MVVQALKDVFESILKLREETNANTLKLLDELMQAIQAAIESIESSSGDHRPTLVKLREDVSMIVEENYVEKCTKELELALTFEKFVDLIAEYFDGGIEDAMFTSSAEWDTEGVMNQLVAGHFYQEGLVDIGDSLVAEAGIINLAHAKRTYFVEMHAILDDLRKGEVGSALEWADKNRRRLVECDSDIEAELHSLRVFEILRECCDKDKALAYVAAHIAPLADAYGEEIVRLQDVRERVRLWEGQTAEEGQRQRAEVADKWRECYCKLRGLSRRSVLSTAVTAGFQALPQMLPMARDHMEEWRTLQELPEEINLTSEFLFRSSFICPVTSDFATNDNPARKLPCGHIITMSTEVHLRFNNSINFFFVECPFCRQSSFIDEVQTLFF